MSEIVLTSGYLPYWYPVSPPQLSTDAPIAFFTEPVEIRLRITRRKEMHFPARFPFFFIRMRLFTDIIHRQLGKPRTPVQTLDLACLSAVQISHAHKPLIRQIRF